MMRITIWRQNGTAPPNTPPTAAIGAFNETAAALKKVPGLARSIGALATAV